MPTGIDPRYDDYKPEQEPETERCGMCGETYDHKLDKWNTTLGVLLVCASCFDEHTKEESHILIELICAK